MEAFPTFRDFTKPRIGHSFIPKRVIGEFGEKYKKVSADIFDPAYNFIRAGDVIVFTLKSGRIGLFRVTSITPDKEVENTYNCEAVFCGYQMKGKPVYFEGFIDAWNDAFNSKYKTSLGTYIHNFLFGG